MADFAISYSHSDAAFTARVREELQRRGFTIWMDEVADGTDAEDIMLPWGQEHWDVITTEFAAADVVVVVDTPNWRASRYCQDEYRFLVEWGKSIEFIPAPEGAVRPDVLSSMADAIATRHADRRTITGAHARLVRTVLKGASAKQSRAERLLGRADERDARLLLASTPEMSGVTMTPALTSHAQEALARAGSARKRLRYSAIASVSILAVLALVGVVALVFARSAYESASASSARSQALELASLAQREPDTVQALAMAHRADELAHSDTTTEAIDVASARDARRRTITVGNEEFTGAAWAAEKPLVVGYSATKLIPIDTEGGSAGLPVEETEGIQNGTVVVSADGSKAAFVSRDLRELRIAHLTENRIESLNIAGVSAVATGDGTDLWWATDGGRLAVASFADPGSPRQEYSVEGTVYALDVTPERQLLDYVDGAGRVHTASFAAATLAELDAFDVTTADKVAPVTRQAAGALKRCGDNLFGGLAGSAPINGILFSRVDGVVTTDRLFGSMTQPVCSDSGAWYSRLSTGTPLAFGAGVRRPYVPIGSTRYLAVADPADKRAAVLTDDGKFYQTFDRATRPFSADGAISVLPMPRGDVYLMSSGDVVDVSTGAVTGHMDSPVPSSASMLGDTAMVVTTSGIAHVDEQGRATEIIDNGGTDSVNYLRAGSDGRHFVATFATSVMVADREDHRTVEFPIADLESTESVADADISPDGGTIVFATNSGRVGAVAVNIETGSVTSPQMWNQRLPGGIHIRISYVSSTGEIVVVPPDGAVRLLDADFNVVARSFFGVEPEHLTAVGDWLIISSLRGGTVLYDARTLRVRDRITLDEVPSTPTTARLDLPNKRLVLLAYTKHTGDGAVRFDVPLPGL